MARVNLTDSLLGPILARDPAGPRVTYYDLATGERIELSAVTLANWAAKTANLLRDELGAEPGSVVAVLLPAHWQTAAVLLGAWWAGARVVLGGQGAEVAFTTADRVGEADADEVAVLSLDPFGRPVPDLAPGLVDYATAVRVHGDHFRAGPDAGGLDGWDAREVLARATASGAAAGWSATDRVLSTRDWASAQDVVEGFAAVLAAGASLVQVAHPQSERLARVEASEKVTARV